MIYLNTLLAEAKLKLNIPSDIKKIHKALKKSGKQIDNVIKGAEQGYSRLKKIMKDRGVEGFGGKTAADDFQAFGLQEAGSRQVIMDANEEAINQEMENYLNESLSRYKASQTIMC